MSDEEDREAREEERRRDERRRRTDAQGAAADLERMGIDPRTLGLDAPRKAPQESRWSDDAYDGGREQPPGAPQPEGGRYPGPEAFSDDANVVALRPEWAGEPRGPDRESMPPRPEVGTSASSDASSGPVVGGRAERDRPTPAEQMLASTTAPVQDRRSGPAPAFQRAARGLVTLDAAASADDERELIVRVRRRQSRRRLVAFVSAQGGVGTTTVAAGVSTVFSALRDDRCVLVDVQAGTPPLSALYGVTTPQTVRHLLGQSDPASPPSSPSGFGIVDGPTWDRPLERSDISGLVERLDVDHTFVLVDAGDDPSDGAYAAVARCDQAVVVAGPGEIGLRALEVALKRLERVNPAAARNAVVVLVCSRDEAQADALRRARGLDRAGRTVVVGPDATLGQGRPFRPDVAGEQTRSAMLQAAALVADTR